MRREAGDIQEAHFALKNLPGLQGPAVKRPRSRPSARLAGSRQSPLAPAGCHSEGKGPTQGLGSAIFIPRRARERAPAPFLPHRSCPSA